MKQLSSAITNLIVNKLGNEPINIVEVQWVVDGNWYVYADKDITNYEFPVDGVIQSLSVLETVVKLDFQSQSTGIDLILSDHKDDLKDIINNHDIHGRLVRIYQWFDGIPLAERFLLYEGEINSPITWSEGERTISFSAITQLADKEVGFSPEEGNFPFLPDNMVGVVWPLIFGTVQNVPSVRLFDVPSTQSAEDLGVTDPSIQEQLDKLDTQRGLLEDLRDALFLAALNAQLTCDDTSGTISEQDRQAACSLVTSLLSRRQATIDQINALNEEYGKLSDELILQQSETNNTLNVVNGSKFPQNQDIIIKLGNLELSGSFSGNIFTITNTTILDYTYEDGDDPFGFTFIQAGTTISIKTENPLIYVLSIVPCEVHFVQVYRRVENDDILVVVPTNWYEVKEVNIGSYTITYIEVSVPISSRDETMQDDLYVTVTSTVGPNTVDIIEWLIDTYTNLSYDTTTFSAVKVKLENYPSHFALLERKNILSLIEEIAFQSRCAIWISNRTFYIKYLPDEETEYDTINEDDIDAGSLLLTVTNTEELVTRLVATWTDNYAIVEPNKLILRHNIKKYGTREREINFYIYNLPELVLKSATFWLIRFSNVWKNIKFKTYLHKLAIEPFDIIKFNFAQNFVANTDVKGMITNVVYDSESNTLDMEAWLPVKFGTMEVYVYSWPGQIDVTNLFPTAEEILIGYAGGDGPGTDTEGSFALEEEELVTIGYITIGEKLLNGIRDQRLDYGDEIPTDIDDVKPTPSFVGVGFEAGNAPDKDYIFNDYPPPGEEDTEPGIESNVFPGQIIKKVVDTINMYEVNVFEAGLDNDPTLRVVKQLQIHEDSPDIPEDTWLFVITNEVVIEGTDPVEFEQEHTMQVPVWL